MTEDNKAEMEQKIKQEQEQGVTPEAGSSTEQGPTTDTEGTNAVGLGDPELIDAIRPVIDPELMLSVVDLGLIYSANRDKEDAKTANVTMTLTSPMCPVGPQIIAGVKSAVENVEGIDEGKVELVWNPPWDPKEMASDEVKDILGIW